MTTLLALRIHGPIAVEPLAVKLGTTAIQLDRQLWELERKGLANYPYQWDGPWTVTEAGRREVDHHEVAVTVRRDGTRACVGVRQQ